MKTSDSQYETMVEFMEKHGDLSRYTGVPRNRRFIQMKWKELVSMLNDYKTGDPRSDQKWRKVWSDYKNKCKKKEFKIRIAEIDSGVCQWTLSDIERRVIKIMETKNPIDMLEKSTFQQHKTSSREDNTKEQGTDELVDGIGLNTSGNCINISEASNEQPMEVHRSSPSPSEGCSSFSSQSAAARTSPLIESRAVSPQFGPVQKLNTVLPPKRRRMTLTKMFIQSDIRAKKYAREREKEIDSLERERLRLRYDELRVKELEIRERVRQRDEELRLQTQWLGLMNDAMTTIVKYMKKRC